MRGMGGLVGGRGVVEALLASLGEGVDMFCLFCCCEEGG